MTRKDALSWRLRRHLVSVNGMRSAAGLGGVQNIVASLGLFDGSICGIPIKIALGPIRGDARVQLTRFYRMQIWLRF